jgi:branched-chain amino acid transport system substrate-binding protein
VVTHTKVATGLAQRATYPYFGSDASKVFFLSHYLYECCHNVANTALIDYMKKQGKLPDLFDNDGFVAAQMIVHAVQKADGDDVDKMISALEGWSFTGPKGPMQIRAADHAMLQPMFIVQLLGTGSNIHPKVLRTLSPATVAPPVRH